MSSGTRGPSPSSRRGYYLCRGPDPHLPSSSGKDSEEGPERLQLSRAGELDDGDFVDKSRTSLKPRGLTKLILHCGGRGTRFLLPDSKDRVVSVEVGQSPGRRTPTPDEVVVPRIFSFSRVLDVYLSSGSLPVGDRVLVCRVPPV